MYHLGKTIFSFRKSSRDDVVFDISRHQGRTYISICANRIRPDQYDAADSREGTIAYVSFDSAYLPEFLEGVEKVKEAVEIIAKGGTLE